MPRRLAGMSTSQLLEKVKTDAGVAPEAVAEAALTKPVLLQALLDGLTSRAETYRYNSFKALLRVSEVQPEILADHWNHLVSMLSSRDAYHRSIAVQLIPNLMVVDGGRRLRQIAKAYIGMLDDESVMAARYVARSLGKVASVDPSLARTVVKALLTIDATHHPEGRKELVKADALQSLGELIESSGLRRQILEFAEAQRRSSSGTTRKAAKAFLARHSP